LDAGPPRVWRASVPPASKNLHKSEARTRAKRADRREEVALAAGGRTGGNGCGPCPPNAAAASSNVIANCAGQRTCDGERWLLAG
jgi:hypothetical protein